MNRDQCVRKYRTSERRTNGAAQPAARGQREYEKQDELLERYGRSLPALAVSRCPLCGTVLRYAFDAYGLDGMWWNKDGIAEAPRPKEVHFQLMLGAVDFHGRRPVEAAANGRVLPGPAAPFVVPRLLKMAGMAAVLSSVSLPRGDTAYLVAYFRSKRVDPRKLHQPWAREYISIEPGSSPSGAGTWGRATDPWDFDLRRWIDAGKLEWIAPRDEKLTLRNSGPCPYADLPGARQPQAIEQGRLRLLTEAEDGGFAPFED